MDDSVAEQIAGRLSTVTFMDLSYCCKIDAHALETIGKHCKLLVGLCRNMHPNDPAKKPEHDDEANAIATTMPKLKRLEMAYNVLITTSILKILSSCSELELLDIRGCWDVMVDDKMMSNLPNLKILGPHVVDCYEINHCDDYSSYSDDSDSLDWEMLHGGGFYEYDDEIYEEEMYEGRLDMDGLELRFYNGNDEDDDYYEWPPSP